MSKSMSRTLSELIDAVDELDYERRMLIFHKCLELKLNIQESSDGSRINLDNVTKEQLQILTEYIKELLKSNLYLDSVEPHQ